jgi:hypothetical protein
MIGGFSKWCNEKLRNGYCSGQIKDNEMSKISSTYVEEQNHVQNCIWEI